MEKFLNDPWGKIRVSEDPTIVQVAVPKVPRAPPPPPPVPDGATAADVADEAAAAVSAQTKRVALQRKATAVMVAAEDYARRFESGDIAVRFLLTVSLYVFLSSALLIKSFFLGDLILKLLS